MITVVSLLKWTTFEDTVWGLTDEEVQTAARGETTLFEGLEVVNLGAFDKEADFEQPGLHKRARAGLGALSGRSMDNVWLQCKTTKVKGTAGYADYDRVYDTRLTTRGSAWGSSRKAVLRLIMTDHITGGGVVEMGGLYRPTSLFGVVTDLEGQNPTIVRMHIEPPYGDKTLNNAVIDMLGGLRRMVEDQALERCLSVRPLRGDDPLWEELSAAYEAEHGLDSWSELDVDRVLAMPDWVSLGAPLKRIVTAEGWAVWQA